MCLFIIDLQIYTHLHFFIIYRFLKIFQYYKFTISRKITE